MLSILHWFQFYKVKSELQIANKWVYDYEIHGQRKLILSQRKISIFLAAIWANIVIEKWIPVLLRWLNVAIA